MLKTVLGMWHSMQELPVLPAAWCVCAEIFSPICNVAARAQGIRRGTELRIFLDLDFMHGAVARHAGRAAFEETFALPQSIGIVRKTARAAIGPIRGIFIARLIVLENRHEIVVVIVARGIALRENIAKRMTLRADHRIAISIEPRLHHHVVSLLRSRRGIVRNVLASRTVAAFAVGAEIEPRGFILVLLDVEIFLLLTDMAGKALLVPDLDLHAFHFVRIGDVEIVEPAFSRDIPARRQHDDFAVRKSGEVMLDASIAERVIDAVLLGLAGEIAFGDIEDAVALAQPVIYAAQFYLGEL